MTPCVSLLYIGLRDSSTVALIYIIFCVLSLCYTIMNLLQYEIKPSENSPLPYLCFDTAEAFLCYLLGTHKFRPLRKACSKLI
jgi:hypothetical protein